MHIYKHITAVLLFASVGVYIVSAVHADAINLGAIKGRAVVTGPTHKNYNPNAVILRGNDRKMLGLDSNAKAFLQSRSMKPPSHVRGLNNDFANRLARFIRAGESAGHRIRIYSGYRSPAHQARLYAAAVRKYGSGARKWVAPPGRSRHNLGIAADLKYSSARARQWAHRNAGQFGLTFRMAHEPWHIEPAGSVRPGGEGAGDTAGAGSAGYASGGDAYGAGQAPSGAGGGTSAQTPMQVAQDMMRNMQQNKTGSSKDTGPVQGSTRFGTTAGSNRYGALRQGAQAHNTKATTTKTVSKRTNTATKRYGKAVLRIAVQKSVVRAGESTRLGWATRGASKCVVRGGDVREEGLKKIVPIGPLYHDTVYMLTCSTLNGTKVAKVEVKVR